MTGPSPAEVTAFYRHAAGLGVFYGDEATQADFAGSPPVSDPCLSLETPAGAVTTVVCAISNSHPDTPLLALCAHLRDRAAEWHRLWAACPDDPDDGPADQAFDAYSDQVWPGFDLQDERLVAAENDPVRQLATLPAFTAEGRRARAVAVYAIEMAEHYTASQRNDFMDMLLLVAREAAGPGLLRLGEDA